MGGLVAKKGQGAHSMGRHAKNARQKASAWRAQINKKAINGGAKAAHRGVHGGKVRPRKVMPDKAAGRIKAMGLADCGRCGSGAHYQARPLGGGGAKLARPKGWIIQLGWLAPWPWPWPG